MVIVFMMANCSCGLAYLDKLLVVKQRVESVSVRIFSSITTVQPTRGEMEWGWYG